VRQTDAKGQVTRNFYDGLGRLLERREHPGSEATTPFVTVTSYDRYADATACGYGKGKACEVRTGTVGQMIAVADVNSKKLRNVGFSTCVVAVAIAFLLRYFELPLILPAAIFAVGSLLVVVGLIFHFRDVIRAMRK
jgi:YD repeat-containing protein